MSDLLLGGRWLLAVVLIVSALSKLLPHTRGRVAEAMRDYGLIPKRLIAPAAVVLPWFELICGVLLCVGIALVITASLVAVMMGVFAGAVAWHVARGHAFDCGCGSGGTRISWRLASRDLALCVSALAVAIGPSGVLAAWPGWGSSHVSDRPASMIPVPLITILALLGLRLGSNALQAGGRQPSRELQPGDA